MQCDEANAIKKQQTNVIGKAIWGKMLWCCHPTGPKGHIRGVRIKKKVMDRNKTREVREREKRKGQEGERELDKEITEE